jgi:phthalate 4,5-dioxygenase reductase subunit
MSDATASLALSLRLARRARIAEGIHEFEFCAREREELPPFTAGAHIQIQAPNGAIRRYSLCNDPTERDRYVIAVKREAKGRGGSASLVDSAREGDIFRIGTPANDFMLAPNAQHLIFIAGGIGITPIMSMIRQLAHEPDRKFQLYYCARSPETTAFREELSDAVYRGRVKIHYDNGDPAKILDLWPVVEERKNRAHLYCCGPRSLMESVRDMTGHWPSAAVHFEAFSEPEKSKPDDRPFAVILAKSGTVIDVPVGTTIIEAMRARGFDVPSSCESGTCGTCRTALLSGEADHRDLVLDEHERSSQIMICVSRARTPTITIDR